MGCIDRRRRPTLPQAAFGCWPTFVNGLCTLFRVLSLSAVASSSTCRTHENEVTTGPDGSLLFPFRVLAALSPPPDKWRVRKRSDTFNSPPNAIEKELNHSQARHSRVQRPQSIRTFTVEWHWRAKATDCNLMIDFICLEILYNSRNVYTLEIKSRARDHSRWQIRNRCSWCVFFFSYVVDDGCV